jgi:hypothetical protein
VVQNAADHHAAMTGNSDRSLAHVYREALRLEAEGHDEHAIADALGLTVEAVPALLVLARKKRSRTGPDADEP